MRDSASRSRSPERHRPRHRPSRHDTRGSHDRRSRPPEHKRRRRSPEHPKRSQSDRAPSGKHRSSRHHHHGAPSSARAELPFSARPLSKADLPALQPLFAHYLSLQKQIELDDLDEREVRGRWKSFVGKWNRGGLAEGWYDPGMFARLAAEEPRPQRWLGGTPSPPARGSPGVGDESVALSDEDDYGPVLPPTQGGRRAGAGVPTTQDLELRDELAREEREAASRADREALRVARKADRAEQRERLDEVAPRAEAGTRERQLEKRQLVNEKMASFRERSPGMDAGDEGQLMGGGDSLAEYKKMREGEQRRKTEREVRREEMERARREEVEERRRAWREREEGTVGMLRELARQRFG